MCSSDLTSNDSCSTFTVSQGSITGGVPKSFSSPVQCFSIRGIDVGANLDPANTTAFVTGVTFDQAGSVSLTQTPITYNLPDAPGPLPLLGAGMFYRWSRRLRHRATSLKG